MSRFIDPIPKEHQPNERDNVETKNVIRAVHTREMVVSNFLPTFIEKGMNGLSFMSQDPSSYSMSVYRSVEECKASLKKYPKLDRSMIGFAIGNTNIEKGIALKPNNQGHIDYFLYDYENNSPCDDFTYLKDKNDE